ncbi:MAG: 3-dehydroquinate synthase [Planctomycetota bacterium]|nr:3-dehydroquinate synthase [Planctomycetota bacterium]MDA1105439.1 3-dehydroquinate synthase [Planctomycetota bacterium]
MTPPAGSHDSTAFKQVHVPFAHRVIFGHRLLEPTGSGETTPAARALREALTLGEDRGARGLVAFVDDGFAAAWPAFESDMRQWVALHLPGVEVREISLVTGGESCKNDMAVVERVIQSVERHHIDRRSAVMAVGGGAVLDAVGLGAALAHRGVRHIRVATTVLSQDDAAMGVKTGVNRFGKKNFVGAFYPPDAVLCDLAHTQTLSLRLRRAGLSEAVKIFALRDPKWFATMEATANALRDGEPSVMEPVIVQSGLLHLDHIVRGGDPFERLAARPLDFGHWSAHRLESLSSWTVPHGEAVAIGIALDCRYARLAGLMPEAASERVIGLLRALGLPTSHALLNDADSVLSSLDEFREHLGGELTITLLRGIGDAVDVHSIDATLVRQAIESLQR